MRPITSLLGCLLTLFALAPEATPSTITVDVNGQGDYSTLFNGVYWAYSAGADTVLVFPGVYDGPGNHDVTLPATDLVLMSRDGPEATIIDLEDGSGITFSPVNSHLTVVDGFTFTNGGTSYAKFAVMVVDGAGCTIRNCVFDDHARVWFQNAGAKRIEDCVFTRNFEALRVSENGGNTRVRSCVFSGNSTGILMVDYGNYPGDFTAVGCVFDDNATAMDIITRSSVVIDSCCFSGNRAGAYPYVGAAIDLSASTAASSGLVRHCTFTNNSSTHSAGAMALHGGGGTVYIEDCTFVGNSAAERGGAFRNWGSPFTMTGCSFSGNTAAEGGAVDTGEDGAAGEAQIVDCVFVDNEAKDGGAVAATHEMTRISGCEFSRNTADMGAAVFSGENRTEITDCLFSENTAYIWGGGVCAVDALLSPGVEVYDSTFENNRSHRGSAVLLDHSLGTVGGCTLFGNSSEDASVVSVRASRLNVNESVMSFAAAGAAVAAQLQAVVHVNRCLSFGNAGGDSLTGYMIYADDCLYADPLLCDVTSNDYTLCANSPCLPENNAWSVSIGAHGQGCPDCDAPVQRTSWGNVKAMFR